MGKLGVLGVGNTLKGDDGIGIVLLNRLKEGEISGEVEFYEVGTSGMNILHHLKDFDTALIIDAVRSKGNPGDSVFFSPDDVDSDLQVRGTHDANLLEAIELSETMGERPEKVVIMGIIPKEMEINEDLSSPLKNSLPELEKKLREKVLTLLKEEKAESVETSTPNDN